MSDQEHTVRSINLLLPSPPRLSTSLTTTRTKKTQEFIPEGATICELYAGVGVIGLNMLGKAKELRFSDINAFLPAAVERTLEGLSEVGMGWCFALGFAC